MKFTESGRVRWAGVAVLFLCAGMLAFRPLYALAKPEVTKSWVNVYQAPPADPSIKQDVNSGSDEAFGRHLDVITSFYGTVITVLTVMLGGVISLAYITVRVGSQAEMDKAIRERVDSETIRAYMQSKVAEQVSEQIGDVNRMIEELQLLYESLDDIVIARERRDEDGNS
ncbi:hypothetical protein KWH07_09865 [Xanthomonas campestris pv. zingibericola]|uniref:hypothetical protein n=1 Tax=Xanthomonas euvesicatoria TaxID=456327 RepID=UPI001C49741E|nr:hypothetical protein [Xanthomonas euvesicatoria]MBV6857942.1 hypothetical protein [Xanthomonas campestris pv. zingibericola]